MADEAKTVTLSPAQIKALLQLASRVTGGYKEAAFLLLVGSAAQILEAALTPQPTPPPDRSASDKAEPRQVDGV